MAERILSTVAADELLSELVLEHGPLVFHQSGGCCDGSAPMCFPESDFRLGTRDVLLGFVGPNDTPFLIGGDQFGYWSHTQLTLDVVSGRGAGFSVEAPRGVRFLIRSRVFTDDEADDLAAAGPPPAGDDEVRRAVAERAATVSRSQGA